MNYEVLSDFIDVKSPKAKGKRFSTLDIARIEDITPEPEPTEPDDEGNSDDNATDNGSDSNNSSSSATPNRPSPASTPAVDVPFTITNEVPEDSRPIDEQLSLF